MFLVMTVQVTLLAYVLYMLTYHCKVLCAGIQTEFVFFPQDTTERFGSNLDIRLWKPVTANESDF